jgi:hypothetical protein
VFAVLEAGRLMPLPVRLGLILPCLFGGLWLSIRYGLGEADKTAFGKLGRMLRLHRARASSAA